MIRAFSVKRMAAVAAVILGLSLAAFVRELDIPLNPDEMRGRIAEFGLWAPLLFMLVAGLRPFLLMPSWIIMSAGGLLFGVGGGIVLSTAGFTFGALMMFSVCRGLGRDVVAEYAGSTRMGRIDRYLTQSGPVWMAAWTGLPVTPLTPVHAAAGLSGMSLLGFALAVLIGFLPRTALYSFFGDSIAGALAEGDWGRLAVPAALLVVGVAVGVIVTRRIGANAASIPPPPSE